MKFLIDNALSPVIAEGLKNAGYDALHVRDFGMQKSSDIEIFEKAENEDRIIVSADTDFGTLLASWKKQKPSFILFRRENSAKPEEILRILLNNIPILNNDLENGSIIVIGKKKIRIRNLPIY